MLIALLALNHHFSQNVIFCCSFCSANQHSDSTWKNVDSDWAFEYEEIKVLDIDDKYINHKITNTEAASIIGVSRGSFFRLVKERKCDP